MLGCALPTRACLRGFVAAISAGALGAAGFTSGTVRASALRLACLHLCLCISPPCLCITLPCLCITPPCLCITPPCLLASMPVHHPACLSCPLPPPTHIRLTPPALCRRPPAPRSFHPTGPRDAAADTPAALAACAPARHQRGGRGAAAGALAHACTRMRNMRCHGSSTTRSSST